MTSSRYKGLHCRLLVVAALLSISVGACGGAIPSSSAVASKPLQHLSMRVGDLTRTYRLYVPPTVTSTRLAPLVLVLHAAMDTDDQTADITGFDDVGAAHSAIVAYPQGLGGTWNGGICCGYAMHSQIDDMAFISTLMANLERTYRVDTTRVYAVGVSNGAIFAYTLACSMAQRFSAIGSVAGTMSLDGCHPSVPVSILEIHGTADVLVPYQGGPLFPEPEETIVSSPMLAQFWAQLNTCRDAPSVDTHGPTTTQLWSECAQTTTVELITVHGGTHVWYGPGLGVTDGAIDATQTIAAFLFQHRRATSAP